MITTQARNEFLMQFIAAYMAQQAKQGGKGYLFQPYDVKEAGRAATDAWDKLVASGCIS